MSLFTVNRYLGEASPQASNKDHAKNILDRLNAKAKARAVQRKSANDASTLVSPSITPAPRMSHQHAEKDTGAVKQASTPVAQKSKKKGKIKGQNAYSDSKLKEDDLTIKGNRREENISPITPSSKRTNRSINDAEDDSSISSSSSKSRTCESTDSLRKRRKTGDGANKDSVEVEQRTPKKKQKKRGDLKDRIGISQLSEKEEMTHSKLDNGDVLKRNLDTEESLGKKKRTKPKMKSKESTDDDHSYLADEKKDIDGEPSVAVETDEVEEEEEEEEDGDEPNEGNFQVLGNFEKRNKKKVQETLPEWLAKPSVIKQSLADGGMSLDSLKWLDARLVSTLKSLGIEKLFPVQYHVIPVILESLRHGLHAGIAGFRPRDVCVSAPTGSGKTLAYAIPLIQALIDRVVPRIRALVVLPTRDLATQVHKVMTRLCRDTSLKVVLVGGAKKFAQERAQLVRESDGEYHSLADIVIATPGRLVDNINQTPGFTLEHLRFLVIDEADRMMDQVTQDWISQVEKSAYSTATPESRNGLACFQHSTHRPKPGPLTVQRSSAYHLPLQKLLFSATLSQNPEKLTQLHLFQPRLITTATGTKPPTSANDARHVDGGTRDAEMEEEGEDDMMDAEEGQNEFVGKYTTPVGLSEYFIQCTAGEKPLVLQHLLTHLHFKQVLCFANTVQATHRLYLLLKLMGGVEAAEFSSNLHQAERQSILRQFKAGKIQILVCSDTMARGMDIENVKCVISYDLPPHLKTYIHRVGRTARAGRAGTAFSLIRKKEVTKFKHMLRNAGKEGIQRHHVTMTQLESLVPAYTDALGKLPAVLKGEKTHQY